VSTEVPVVNLYHKQDYVYFLVGVDKKTTKLFVSDYSKTTVLETMKVTGNLSAFITPAKELFVFAQVRIHISQSNRVLV
jgi:hypothetical protein